MTTAPELLIIEPDPDDLASLLTVGSECDFSGTGVSTAGEAWEILEKTPPKALIISNSLPDRGLTIITKIRAAGKAPRPLIFAVCEADQPTQIDREIEEQTDFVFAKPLSPVSLKSAWKALTGNNQQARKLLAEKDEIIHRQREEMDELQDQIEEAFAVSNQTAMEAEVAYIELNMIFKAVDGGIVLVGKDYRIIRFNDAFLEIAGVSREDAVKLHCADIFPNHNCESPSCTIKRIIGGESNIEFELVKKRPDESIANYRISANPYKGPGGELVGAVIYILDITEQVRIKKELEISREKYRTMSLIDELTGLFNKRHFNHILQLEIDRSDRYGHPLSLIMMDIDNFKHHNDTYGHDEGDRVLARLGGIIKEAVRSCDIPCRYGGEEFTVILPDTVGDQAMVVAERIRLALAGEPFHPTPDEEVIKTLSLGVAELQKGDTASALLRRADQNLYRAKNSGKNRCCLE